MKTKYILFLSAILIFSISSCRKIESDGQIQVVVVNGGGTGTTGQTITLQGRITSDTVLRKSNTYILKGIVYIANNKTLTIEPGTTIKGSFNGADVAALVITRGSKIIADGTAVDPIIFTSLSPNPQSGDWGGIIICGKGPTNASFNSTPGLLEVEGGINNSNGDGLAGSGDANTPVAVPNDNSGILRYVRIEYAGYAFQPDKEINSLTMACLGNGTTIENVQVTYAKDDAFEWFGGNVNCKYLVAYKTQDDDFDTDNGYSGKVQFGLVIRDSVIADISRSQAFESDNNAAGTNTAIKTSCIFSNITAIGPRATLSNFGSTNYRGAAHLRRNSGISIFNSILIGWSEGILIDASTGSPTDLNFNDSSMRLRNITIAGCNTSFNYSSSASAPTGMNSAGLVAFLSNPYFGNDILTNASDARLIQPFNYAAPDPTPFAGSNGNQKILTGGNFNDAKFTGDTFFDKTVTFRGAIAPAGSLTSWWKGWSKF